MVKKNLGNDGSNLKNRSDSHRKTKNEKKIPEEENKEIERRKRGKRKKISVDKLFLDPANVRGEITYEDDDAFADDIERHGVEENLVVRPIECVGSLIADNKLKELVEQGCEYAVISGGRRLRAAKERGIKKVWCIVKELSDYHAAGRSVAENITKHDPPWGNILHIIKGMVLTIEKETKSMPKIARKLQEEIGVDRRTAYRYVRASRLPYFLLDLLNPPEHRKKEWKVFEAFIEGGYVACDLKKEQLALTVAEYIGQKIMANVNVDWNDNEELIKLQTTCILCMCKNKKDAYAFIDEISPIWTEIEDPLIYDPYVVKKYGKTKAKTEEPKKEEIEEPSRPELPSSIEKTYVTKMRNADNIGELVVHINHILDWFDKVKDNWWRGIFQHTLSSLEKIREIYNKHKAEFD